MKIHSYGISGTSMYMCIKEKLLKFYHPSISLQLRSQYIGNILSGLLGEYLWLTQFSPSLDRISNFSPIKASHVPLQIWYPCTMDGIENNVVVVAKQRAIHSQVHFTPTRPSTYRLLSIRCYHYHLWGGGTKATLKGTMRRYCLST